MIEWLEPDDLGEVLAPDNDRPAIVAAWAPGCGACHQVSRVLQLLAEHHCDIDFYRLNVSSPGLRGLLATLDLRVAPTVLLFLRGTERLRLTEPGDMGRAWELLEGALQAAAPPLG